jgi:hypothetical protein
MAYTTIDDPSVYFQTALYTGNSGNQSITNDGNSNLQADWIWLKERSSTSSHHFFDSTRGVGDSGKALIPNSTGAEGDDTAFRSFDSDGFTLASTNGYNQDTITNVAWQWKANGGTTSSNSSGSITSTVQANTTAGFSIATWTGTGSTGTIGHGLSSTPDWIILKNRDASKNWIIYHKGIPNSPNEVLFLNLNNEAADQTRFNDTSPTASVFSIGSESTENTSGDNHIGYCFAEKQGYSKFGSYTGNGNADGPFVYLGFKPAWILFKRTDATEDWFLFDSKRDISNPNNDRLLPNLSNAESESEELDFLSNGFKIRTGSSAVNTSGGTYIYMAFAEHPFVSSEGVPTTAR